jgi:CheY-like chemotaxis protein
MAEATVLLVENEQNSALLIQRELRNLGYVVTDCVASGEEGLR